MDAMLTKKTEELAKELATQATTLDELNGVMRSLMKTALETTLNSELDVHLGRGSDGMVALSAVEQESFTIAPDEPPQPRNRKNGFSPKVNFKGKKELLGLWLDETEGAKFWLSCLTDLKNRGLNDIFIVCVNGLSGFPEAIQVAYPQARVQLCIVHLVRAALKYVNDTDSRAVIADLKKIYQAATVLEAEQELENFATKWDDKYPTISKQWRLKWPHLITMFELPAAIRRATYTTNVIESVNSVIRKFTRNRKQYPNRVVRHSSSTISLIVIGGSYCPRHRSHSEAYSCDRSTRTVVRASVFA